MVVCRTVPCGLSGFPTVQSYDMFSVPARGFRPGAASFPTCRAAWLLQRVCVCSQAYRGVRGTPAFRGPGEGETRPFLFPNWRNFVTQLDSNFFPVRQQYGTVRCLERPQCPASTGTELGCRTSILSTNQLFIYTNFKSTSRARDKLVFINLKNRCFLPLLSSPGLKTGQTVVGCAGANRFQWTRDTVDTLPNAS